MRQLHDMTEWHEIAQLLDSCHSLVLCEIGEPEENVLRMLLVETFVSAEPESLQVGGTTIEDLHRVQPTSSSRRFELTWNQYIAYGVTNESFGSATGTEAPDSARLLRVYIESPFLDFVARSTLATKQYPGPYTHVQVLSENHIVDVVSTVLPVLRIVAPS